MVIAYTIILTYFEKEKIIKNVVITNPELMLINMFTSTFAPNLMTLTWKISPEMPKPAG